MKAVFLLLIVAPVKLLGLEGALDTSTSAIAPETEISTDGWGFAILGSIGWFFAILIVLVISLRSFLDLVIASGFAPQKLTNWLNKRERQRFREYIEDVGMTDRISRIRALSFWLDRPRLIPERTHDDLCKRFLTIAHKSVDHYEIPLEVGTESQMKTHNYLNLRRAFCKDNHCAELTELMGAYIRLCLGNEIKKEITCVISRKSGLDLLGFSVATWLHVPFVLFHDDQDSVKRSNGFEYLPDETSKFTNAIIVDDSCVGGNFILEIATQWRAACSHGQNSVHAFVFFIRKKEVSNLLNIHNICLHALCFFSDEHLSDLKNKGPNAVDSCIIKDFISEKT